MRILLTGANGFIGSALVNLLSKENPKDEIFCLIRGEVSKKLADSKNIKILYCDLLKDAPKNLPKKIDKIIHLASISKTFLTSSEARRQFMDNIALTHKVIEISEKFKADQLVFASSVYVYSGNKNKPFKENASLFPLESLGASKFASEMILKSHSTSSDLNVCSLRLFTVFGPNSRDTQFIPEAIRKLTSNENTALFGNPFIKRDFVFITDVVNAFKLALAKDLPRGYSVFNIGSGKSQSIKKTVLYLKKLLDSNKEVKFKKEKNKRAADSNHEADISLAKKNLAWEPNVSFEEGAEIIIKQIINKMK